jgi:hypothetical protein
MFVLEFLQVIMHPLHDSASAAVRTILWMSAVGVGRAVVTYT